jgi:RNA polymerase sigma factor (TIGR02999 family)
LESARRRHSQKRGGDGVIQLVQFDESMGQPVAAEDDILKIDAALQELSRFSPRQALMVEYRFFGGLEVNETAELLQVSEATLTRDWRLAKSWLARELRRR